MCPIPCGNQVSIRGGLGQTLHWFINSLVRRLSWSVVVVMFHALTYAEDLISITIQVPRACSLGNSTYLHQFG